MEFELWVSIYSFNILNEDSKNIGPTQKINLKPKDDLSR